MGKYVKPLSIADAESRNELCSFSMNDKSHHLAVTHMWIGFQTKQILLKLLNGGDINEHTQGKLLAAAKSILVKVATYLQKWCRINA